MDKKRITINTVAERANVSKSTVSRYLNGKFEMISEEKIKSISKAIEELEYRPNRLAQSLKSNRSGVIGCIVSDIGSPFSSILVKGVNKICLEQGYQLILTDSEDNALNEKKAIESLLERSVDGLIINSTGENDEYILDLSKNKLPIVLADRPLSIKGDIDTVLTDNKDSILTTLYYLKKVGYTKVALFSSSMKRNEVRRIRYYAFCDAEEKIFQSSDGPSVYFYDNFEECRSMVSQFVSKYPKERVAIFAINGVSLLDVLKVVINYTGIKIGSELGICGFDNWGWADLIEPGITTINQNTWDVGAESAKLLFNRLNNSDKEIQPVKKVLKNNLEIRGSTVSN